MIDAVLDIIESDINFENIALYLVLYFAIMWFIFSGWVFFDALKRYNKLPLAVAFFFLTLIFNFPMLIFYVAIRPDDEHGFFNVEHDSDQDLGGLNIPVANFVKDGEVSMQISLTISDKMLQEHVKQDNVKLDINLTGESIEEQKTEDGKPSFAKAAEDKQKTEGGKQETDSPEAGKKDSDEKGKKKLFSGSFKLRSKLSEKFKSIGEKLKREEKQETENGEGEADSSEANKDADMNEEEVGSKTKDDGEEDDKQETEDGKQKTEDGKPSFAKAPEDKQKTEDGKQETDNEGGTKKSSDNSPEVSREDEDDEGSLIGG